MPDPTPVPMPCAHRLDHGALPSHVHPSLARRGHHLAATWALGAALLLSACASPPREAPLDPVRVRQFEARAYAARTQADTRELHEARVVQGEVQHLVWMQPAGAGPHPLVVCLPGVGQSAQALAALRRALAEAGYVVLSWQVLPEDARLPSRPGEPQADVRAWAQTRFAAAASQRRVALLAALMASLPASQAAGDPLLAGVDLGHAALLGYELGAWTAQQAEGEEVLGVSVPESLRLAFGAFVLVSPHASFEQGGFETRYRGLRTPTLVLTSEQDRDPLGLVPEPYLRTAPFGGMPGGQQFMLMLRQATHADLGARTEGERLPAWDSERPRGEPGRGAMGDGQGAGGPDGGGGGGGGRGGSGPGGGAGGGPGGGGPGGARGGRGGGGGESAPASAAATQASPTLRAMQASAMTAVTLAFLDATLQDDAVARTWLKAHAPDWLNPVGDLFAK